MPYPRHLVRLNVQVPTGIQHIKHKIHLSIAHRPPQEAAESLAKHRPRDGVMLGTPVQLPQDLFHGGELLEDCLTGQGRPQPPLLGSTVPDPHGPGPHGGKERYAYHAAPPDHGRKRPLSQGLVVHHGNRDIHPEKSGHRPADRHRHPADGQLDVSPQQPVAVGGKLHVAQGPTEADLLHQGFQLEAGLDQLSVIGLQHQLDHCMILRPEWAAASPSEQHRGHVLVAEEQVACASVQLLNLNAQRFQLLEDRLDLTHPVRHLIKRCRLQSLNDGGRHKRQQPHLSLYCSADLLPRRLQET
mmetsp:Transcript_32762/g.85003  ORF Transcript_32762/g.85003 Transcript_32762/m.85003 type:complete len:300 (-) Transcript_32762:894-1793(-)